MGQKAETSNIQQAVSRGGALCAPYVVPHKALVRAVVLGGLDTSCTSERRRAAALQDAGALAERPARRSFLHSARRALCGGGQTWLAGGRLMW
jgi:hypothetical protein